MHKLKIQYDIDKNFVIDEVYNVDCICNNINKLLENDQLIPALFLALLIPDICGKIISDRKSGPRYIEWFNKYVKKEYRITSDEKEEILQNLSPTDKGYFEQLYSENPYYFDGKDCYSLRSNLLHSNLSKISKYEPSDKQYVQENTMSQFGLTLNSNDFDIINPTPIYVNQTVKKLNPKSSSHEDGINTNPQEVIPTENHDIEKGPYLLSVSISIKNLSLNICKGYYQFYSEIRSDEEKMNMLMNSYELNIWKETMR